MKRNHILFLVVTIFLTQLSFAQVFNRIKLDSFFDALETNNRFMGSVAVSKKDSMLYRRAMGFADVGENIKTKANTKYRIGSISKTFTAVMVFQGVEAGKIELRQTIGKYFPNFPMGDTITINHLLTHQSGIHDFTSSEDYLTWNTEARTRKDMVRTIARGGVDFEPGTKAQYSTSNYVLLSYILEYAYKMPYSEILQEYIAIPLGLGSTYFGRKININDNESNSYRWRGTWEPESETNLFVVMGAGGVVSTSSDLVRFSNALFGGKLIKEQNLNRMQTLKDNLGMGLFKYPFNQNSGFGHTGEVDGFYSIFIHFSKGDISYALTSNGTNFNINDITIAILSAVYKEPYEIPQFNTILLTSDDLDKYLGTYSSTDVPLEIVISKKNATLIAQPTGQPASPLEASAKDVFKFAASGVVFEFDPVRQTILLKQGGGRYFFKRKSVE